MDFFFVLSGFVLSWSWKPERTALRFYWLRFARIWPLHIATLLAATVAFTPGSTISYLLSPLLLQSWHPSPAVHWGLNGVSWTLSVEAFFYATFPILMPALHRAKDRTVWAVAAFSATLMLLIPLAVEATNWDPTTKWWIYAVLPLTRLPQFVLVICVAVLVIRGAAPRVPTWATLVAALALFAIAPAASMPVWLAAAILTVIAAAAIGALAQTEPTWPRPVPGWLVALGEWSFALYLTHSLLLKVLGKFGLHGWTLFAVALPATVALSALAYLLWERPAEAWLRRHRVGEPDRQTALA